MDENLTHKWIEELRMQCRFATFAWHQMRSSLISMDNDKSFFYVHAFLNHAMETARILWPEDADGKERGASLRQSLETDDASLLNQASLRRIITRFDERFELWISTLSNPHFLTTNVMPKGTMAGSREDVFVRSLDPETYQLEILDQHFDLRKLHDALRQVDQSAEHWLRKH